MQSAGNCRATASVAVFCLASEALALQRLMQSAGNSGGANSPATQLSCTGYSKQYFETVRIEMSRYRSILTSAVRHLIHFSQMPAIGITGGISTGKSTFCQFLGEIMPVAKFFDADETAHQLIERDPQVKKEIASEFGADVFSREGDLNRKALGAIIFGDAARKKALEQILHPRIRRQWSAEAETHRKSHKFFFADIPLLYETGGETLCDRVVAVACSPAVQVARLLERRAMERGAAEEMIKSQMPLEEKISRADHVVWNNGDRALLKQQAELLAALWRRQ
jgi:dephospho-CoA kinase